MNNINHKPISTSTNHESAMPDLEDGILNEETFFDMSIIGDKAGFSNMMQIDIEPQSVQVPSHVSVEDVLKMQLFTLGEAREFYTSYSRLKGFAIRKSKRVKNAKGKIVRYTFVCNRQGFRHKKWLDKLDRKREHKPITRCGYVAEMRIKKNYTNGKWFVLQFVDDHNHTLLSERFIGYLPSNRNMSNIEIAQMNSMRQVGISIPKIYQSFAMQNGDVNAALHFFERAARNDDKLFWRYEVAAGSHMCDIIWSDGRSQKDYEAFSDVLAFDATNGRNKYNLSVIVLSRVNHHNQTCVFATAMVSCESQDSYKWVLRRFLECIRGKAPKCMLTDIEVDEFEMQWEVMVDECGVREVEWVMDLYRKKLDKEEELDFRSFYGTPVLQTQFPEIERSSDCENGCCYVIQKYRQLESTWQVLHQLYNGTFRCNCRRMESHGIPCVHIIVVLVGIDIGSLPKTLVLKS
ncbi:protein FAR-RED ELONGATED HYPOCOTYL 3-like [Arachis stenosperma]|uniref:protein FAR-RED ELONGATED HYPOCOTYL 3-like n=1 Tax=Arachis stenosperma TaxID=217475 RepID=UPI0025AB79CD|nr:protein FAR-RED ELONGATED HYPOCOTYL 3-like [Arachis stenosperma]